MLFVLNFLEGSIITLGAGLSLPATGLNFSVALTVLMIADIVSDITYYLIGRSSSAVLESKYAKYVGINHHRLAVVKGYYDKHGKVTLFFAKMSDVLAMPAIVLAGVSEMRLPTFLTMSIATSILKGVTLFTAGYLLSDSVSTQGVESVVHLISGLCVLVVTILMFKYFYEKIKNDGQKTNKK